MGNVAKDVKIVSSYNKGEIHASVSSLVTGESSIQGLTLYIKEDSEIILNMPKKPKITIRFGAVKVGSVVPFIVMAMVDKHLYKGWIDYHRLDGKGKLATDAISIDKNIIIAFVGESNSKENVLSLIVSDSLRESFIPTYQLIKHPRSWQPFLFESIKAQMETNLPSDEILWEQFKRRE